MAIYLALIMKCEDCSHFILTGHASQPGEDTEPAYFPDPRERGWELVWVALARKHVCHCPHHRTVDPEPMRMPR
jgi:hypothetical protein